ncbi:MULTISPECIES: cupin domain-containing protein [unclassified Streptomyces]|uniref:cupin domain-containing protein n=1 Tax=unclassified Streptomyces TaxID=2593676 RepID=UPI000DAEE55A|nr:MULTISPECIES: cupin domain-containing protein [unclassified Streptomyces]PZT72442.1 cupin [Streptomyces sp. AC1-42T]PZT81239.1 cupin [Streptomyces sp. AC1-42W]
MSPLNLAAHLGQDEFLAQVYHRRHHHVPTVLPNPSQLISWDDVNTILATHRLEPPRFRLSADGKMLPAYLYTAPVATRRHTVWQRLHPAELRARLADGASLVIDAIDELLPSVGRSAMELEQWLRTGVQANLYASWTAREGFGVHWDDHDVVVVQIDGVKRWKVYGPTRTAPMYKDTDEPEPPPEDPVTELVLRPGDLLYLPRGWWHSVAASEGEHSLHLTFGIQTTTGAQLLAWLADDLRRHDILREDLPVHAPPEQQAAYLDRLRKEVIAALDDPRLIGRYTAMRDSADLTRLRPSLPHITGVPADPEIRVRLTTTRARLEPAADGAGPAFRACDNEWEMAQEALPLLQRLTAAAPSAVSVGELAEASCISVTDAAAVVSELMTGQAITVEGGGR